MLTTDFSRLEHTRKREKLIESSVVIIPLLGGIGVLTLFAVIFGASLDQVLESYYRSFFDYFNISENLALGTAIIMMALGISVAFKAGMINIGAEGQLMIGGLTAAVIALNLYSLIPSPLIGILAFLSGGVAGLAWVSLPCFLKIKFGVNEILTTVLMNYLAYYFVSYLLHGPLWSRYTNFPETDPIPIEARFPRILPYLRVTWASIILVVLLTLTLHVFLSRISYGWKLQIVGFNPSFAKASGINISLYKAVSLLFSGFLSGLAGAYLVQTLFYKMRMEVSAGYGFTAIITALAGRLNPILVTLVSYFVVAIIGSCTTLTLLARLPIGLAYVFQSTLIIILLMYDYLVFKFKFRNVMRGLISHG